MNHQLYDQNVQGHTSEAIQHTTCPGIMTNPKEGWQIRGHNGIKATSRACTLRTRLHTCIHFETHAFTCVLISTVEGTHVHACCPALWSMQLLMCNIECMCPKYMCQPLVYVCVCLIASVYVCVSSYKDWLKEIVWQLHT
jgi:hypothetical protein